MKSILTSIVFIFGLALCSQAQNISRQVISNGGGYSESGNFKLSYTFGEYIAGGVESGSFILTQGFQQGFQYTDVAIEELDIKVDYTLYPNPSTDFVNIKLVSEKKLNATVSIVNSIGETVSGAKEINSNTNQVQFNVALLPKGIYYMNILFEQKTLKKISFMVN